MRAIKEVLNWKKHPANVFLLALPLAVLGFALLSLKAYLHYRLAGDWVYALIYLTGVVVFVIALLPLWRQQRQRKHIESGRR